MSGDRKISCGSCHDPAFGSGDGLARGIDEGGAGAGLERVTIDALDTLQATGLSQIDAECTTYLTATSETGVSCHWEYPYRSVSALQKATTLWETLSQCRDGKARAPDTQVNHPDSYDLQALEHGNTVYTISVKDKAALNLTLVFLRREPTEEAD